MSARRTITFIATWGALTFMLVVHFPERLESQQRPAQSKLDRTQPNLHQNLPKILRQITPTGWKICDSVKQFNSETLYVHIDGRAELYAISTN